jgi:prepilin-type processing-associated H-X9-DG protein
LPYVEQANKLNQFNLDYDVNGSTVNTAGRSNDVPFFLCPSDPSNQFTFTNAGRLNYFGNNGITADQNSNALNLAGVFNVTLDLTTPIQAPGTRNPNYRRLLGGVRIADITDGTSNTTAFAEVMRSRETNSATGSGIRDNITVIIDSANGGWNDTDGTTIPTCQAGAPWVSSIKYVGQQYYRNLPSNYLYAHTLPINWNKRVFSGTQRYSCGHSSFSRMHVSASSYHSGGVNACMADGSVRFFSDNTDFAVWRMYGTRAGGEVIPQ